jgi:hypothetical protein
LTRSRLRFAQGLHFGEQRVTGEMILESHGAVVFVIDAQDKPYHYPIQNFIDTVRTVKMFNEAFEFEVCQQAILRDA